MTDKDQVDRLQVAALAVLKTTFGQRVKGAGGTFNALTAKLSFEFELVSGELRADSLRAEFTKRCLSFNLVASDFDLLLQAQGGDTITLTGFSLRSFKFPFLGRTSDGRNIRFTAKMFLAARARAQASCQKTA